MRKDRDYSDIPGTYVFDPEHSRQGYHLNMFCMSLNKEANREEFRRDESAYLDVFPMSPEQRDAVLQRDWIGLLRLELRLLGFAGVIEVIGDLLPDQLPMAAASGIDAILIRTEHARRCEESHWRLKSGDKNRFGYQRSVAGG